MQKVIDIFNRHFNNHFTRIGSVFRQELEKSSNSGNVSRNKLFQIII